VKALPTMAAEMKSSLYHQTIAVGNETHPLQRLRYQLLGGLLLAVGLPLVARMALEPRVVFSINHQVTIAAAIIAHMTGYMTYKRLDAFPGMATFSTILPAFTLSYGLVFLAIFFFRFEYSRFQAAGSFFISASWYFSLNAFTHRMEPYRLAIVPGGNIDRLAAVDGVVWQKLFSPDAVPGKVLGVVADLRADLPETWERFITGCVLSGTPVYHVKHIVESLTGRVEIEHLSENTLGSLNPNQIYFKIKRILDWLGALAVLVILLPLFLILALAIRLETPGPALFRQRRVGYRGALFTLYKFRTMRVEDDGAMAEKERAITRDGDERITRIGRVLRRTRLDELPQAINILGGQMSWIGPRPEAAVLSRWYERELPFYPYRHIVRPGVTGWAQVNQGHVAAVSEVHEKLHYDFYYIKNFSPWLDLVIVMRTIRIMLTGFGAR
jgi:lipopolysaccharide/colanic/teichoic acid biosynthesis glycosyltransferase